MITNFKDPQYTFLSNFYPCPVFWSGTIWASAEHAYQAAKSDSPEYRHRISQCVTAGKAKREGKHAPLREDWEKVKLAIMLEILQIKFRDGILKKKLLDTGSEILVEGNQWGDIFWGQCPVGKGQNWLGRLLMVVRSQLHWEAS